MISQNSFLKICSNCGKNIQRHNFKEILACLIYHNKQGSEKITWMIFLSSHCVLLLKVELDIIDVSSIDFTDEDFQKWYNENFSDKKYELVNPWPFGIRVCIVIKLNYLTSV